MADPLAIVGATAAAIEFTKVSWKIVNIACDHYKSESGALEDQETLKNITQEMQISLAGLMKEPGGCEPLVARCKAIGEEILGLLMKNKTGAERSITGSIKFSIRKIWTEEKLEKLQTELNRLMVQLGIHLHNITSSDLGSKLTLLLEESGVQQEWRNSVTKILESLRTQQKTDLDALEDLRRLFVLPQEALGRLNEEIILEAVSRGVTDARLTSVFSAKDTDTFGWSVCESEIPESHPELEISFRDWLARGKGIFHISGKMGSGKSTLMKYIWKERETSKLLKQWAGERECVRGAYFFWRAGTSLQKTFEGLYRTLLWSILSKQRQLIRHVFSQHWHPHGVAPWTPHPELKFGLEEVQQAFEALITKRDALGPYCFCFFIDGLDEFEDPNPLQTHRFLVKRLRTWVNENPDNLKLCVSSREDDPFMDLLSPKQRLRIHLLTEKDMLKTAETHLEQHENFLSWPEDCRCELIHDIVHRANGVFIWLTFVLRDISESLDQKQDEAFVREQLKTLPDEVDAYFRQILDRIPRRDRKEAWTIFALVCGTRELEFDARPSLLHYSFAKHLDSNTSDALWTNAKDFIRKIQPSQPTKRVGAFKDRLQGLCRGLVEVQVESGTRMTTVFRQRFSGLVRLGFVHRSIFELFEDAKDPEMRHFIESFDFRSAYLGCLALDYGLRASDTLDFYISVYLMQAIIVWGSPYPLQELCVLDNSLDATWVIRLCERGLSIFDPAKAKLPLFVELALTMGFPEYIKWRLENTPNFFVEGRVRTCVLLVLLQALDEMQSNRTRRFLPTQTLQHLLEAGFELNLSFPDLYGGLSPWEALVCYDIIRNRRDGVLSSYRWQAVAMCLKQDLNTNPDFWFRLDSGPKVHVLHGDRSFTFSSEIIKGPSSVWITSFFGNINDTRDAGGSETPSDLIERSIDMKPCTSFRNYIERHQPDNMQELLRLVDRNMEHCKRSNQIQQLGDEELTEVSGNPPVANETDSSLPPDEAAHEKEGGGDHRLGASKVSQWAHAAAQISVPGWMVLLLAVAPVAWIVTVRSRRG